MSELQSSDQRGSIYRLQEIESKYEEILGIVYTQVKNSKSGILFKAIRILLRDRDDDKTLKEIYRLCGIKEDASREEDQAVIDQWVTFTLEEIGAIENFEQDNTRRLIDFKRKGANFIKSRSRSYDLFKASRPAYYLGTQQEDNMGHIGVKLIIAGALILVGLAACLKFYEEYRKSSDRLSSRSPDSPPPPPQAQAISVSLCLVVPSHVVASDPKISLGQSILEETIESLIDNASYFLCTKHGVNSYEQSLSFLPGVEIPSDNQREVYVRIEISDGKEMLGKSIPYALKSNLKPGARFTVQKVSLLRDLSGLDKFNRI